MVTAPRTPLSAGRLRALNAPRAVQVRTDANGAPIAVRLHRDGTWQRVTLQERWRLDDEWWRDRIERHYYAVTLPHGARLTLYRDATSPAESWYRQGYS